MEQTNYEEEQAVEEVVEEETTEEDVEETEDESEDTTEEESTEDVDWKERAMKAERAIEKAKKKKKTVSQDDSADPEEMSRLKLKVEGVKDDEDIDYVLRVAKAEGVDPVDAASIDFVQDRLAANKRKRQSAQATPRSNNRASAQGDEIAALAAKYNKDGSLPDNMAKVAQVMNYLKANS